MAKPKIPNQKKANLSLIARLQKYILQVQAVYDGICSKIGNAVELTDYDGIKEFSFGDYPELSAPIKSALNDYVSSMGQIIHSGTSKEWRESNLLQDLLAEKVLKAYDFDKGGDKYKRYFQPNSDALKAFQERAVNGMKLSDKLWVQAEGVRKELECAISASIDRGQSAITLSKRLSQYLNDFPSLQKDYGEKFGKAAKCKDCEYASMRLARSEINMAYRTAEHKRWQQFDFILGFEVKLSGRHPANDICNDLAGKYPKDFKFVGWHPNCMCYAVPIVMSDTEYYGEAAKKRNLYIDDVPDGYKLWVLNNQDRIANYKNLPYFLADNPKWREFSHDEYHVLREDAYNKAEKSYRKELRRQKYERMVIYDDKGKIIGSTGGNLRTVYFDNETAKAAKDNTVMHNHPNEGRIYHDFRDVGHSFGSDDMNEVAECDMKRFIAVSQTYQYEIERPSTGWGFDGKTIKKDYARIYDRIVDEYKMQEGTPRFWIVQHLTMKELAKKWGFKYIKKKYREIK